MAWKTREGTRVRLAAFLDAASTLLRGAAAVIDVLVRLSLAKAFFEPGMLQGAWLAQPASAHWLLIAVQIGGPLLLALGWLVRPVALGLMLLTLVQPDAGAMGEEHLLWVVLFGWYLLHGAGVLSLDHLLDRGLGFSPLPFAGPAIKAAHWTRHHLAPVYRLAVRLWLAACLTAPFISLGGLPLAKWAMLPQPLAFAAAVLLVLGLGTPVVAICVVFASAAMVMGEAAPFQVLTGMTPYGPLLLLLLGAVGAGRYSLDDLFNRLAHRRAELDEDAPHVVIVGAGFGGLACAMGLRHEGVRITLIDRQNHHLFQPLLYQVATGSLSPADIATPIRAIFRHDPGVRVLCASVSAVDTTRRVVTASGRSIPYDALVLATGATHGYFGKDHWAKDAPGLKSVADATAIRSRILNAFERAEACDDPGVRAALLTFVVVGAGPTGVELAGAIAELARHGMAKDFRNFDPATARILLVQAGPRVLPQFIEPLSAFALEAMAELGVEVMLDKMVEDIDAGGVVVSGERIAAATVLWAAGVVASPAASWLGAAADRAGRVTVGPDLSVPGLPDVFAVGDTAFALDPKGAPVPGLAPAAKQGGAYVASVLRARLRGRKPPPPFAYHHQGSLATIGRKSAVADFGRLRMTGALAWWLWGAVHILFLGGLRNRTSVVLGWVWSYFTFEVGVRLITGSTEPKEEPLAGM